MFVVVANEGSFSKAARALGISAVAVSKSIAQLEKTLGVRLFHRTTHKFSLSEEGYVLFQKVEPHVAEIKLAIEQIMEQGSEASGVIKVNLAESFGREMILPLIGEFLDTYPKIELDIVFDDKVLDPIEEGFDISIGNLINEDSRIIARQIYTLQVGLFASPNYLNKSPAIKEIDDLQSHKAIVYKQLTTGRKVNWRLKDKEGQYVQILPQGRLTVSNIDAAKNAAVHGFGIAAIGSWSVEHYLTSKQLVPILQQHWPESMPIWLYYTSKEFIPHRVRLLIDFLTQHKMLNYASKKNGTPQT
jgi:DNA-binding transcriptional LysR family regulator